MEIQYYHRKLRIPEIKKYKLIVMENEIIDNLTIVNDTSNQPIETVIEIIKPESVHEVVPEPIVETVSEVVVETVPEHVVDVVPETVVETVPEVISEVVPEPVVETVPEVVPETVVETVPEVVPETVVETVPEVVPEPVVESIPEVVPEPVVESVPEPVVKIVDDILENVPDQGEIHVQPQIIYDKPVPVITTNLKYAIPQQRAIPRYRAGMMKFF
jgi:hypothetical protein